MVQIIQNHGVQCRGKDMASTYVLHPCHRERLSLISREVKGQRLGRNERQMLLTGVNVNYKLGSKLQGRSSISTTRAR